MTLDIETLVDDCFAELSEQQDVTDMITDLVPICPTPALGRFMVATIYNRYAHRPGPYLPYSSTGIGSW